MRITIKHLKALAHSLNEMTDSPTEYMTGNKCNVGHFCIGQQYGGYSLERIANTGGGVTHPLGHGTMSARELYDQMHAFMAGIRFAALTFNTIR